MSHGTAAKSARLNKERNPAAYCRNARCLWRVKHQGGPDTPCPRHPLTIAQELAEMEARDPGLKALGDRINAVGDAIAARQAVVPPVGTRYTYGERDMEVILEYIGPNPDKVFETADAHLIRAVTTRPGCAPVGNVSVVDVLWFENHRRVLR